MNAYLVYIVEANLYVALFAICYHFLFRNERYHRTNRWVILGSLVTAFLIPAVSIQATHEAAQMLITLDPVIISAKANIAHTPTGYNYPSLISILYWLGFLVCAGLLAKRFTVLNRLLKSGIEKWNGDVRLVNNPKITSPASIFKTIFISDTIPGDMRDYIVAHELVHIREKHTVDLLFMELIQALCWFNPAVYFLRKALEASHEFRADEVVLRQHPNIHKYSEIIVSQAMDCNPGNLAHSFSKPNLIKRRIMMLKSNQTRKTSGWKYLLLIPVVGGVLFLNACTQDESNDTPKELQKSGDEHQNQKSSTPMEIKKIEGTDIYAIADKMPQYPGGTDAMVKYLSENIKYPQSCKDEGVEGIVYVGFVIDEAGNLIDLNVLRSPDERLSANALEVIGKMPQWTPGEVDNQPVKVQYNLPIRYTLK